MSMPSKVDTLYDQTSAANTALNTGSIDTSSYDAILACIVYSGAASGAPNVALLDFATGVQLLNDGVSATATNNMVGYGPGGGAYGDNVAGYTVAAGTILPPAVRMTVGAAGVGITTHLVVYGRRNFRGSVPNTNTINGITPRVLD